ncbi:DUF1853 family protein [Sneathiella glossodoripedis]|uniref:DUF1853 family protein n=1 Tax=Sneathiella glossodoripedis TaxID=418853 RepID=UPI000471B445|nr:DUF1853 family protein [Sneathiella glossodoripedis]
MRQLENYLPHVVEDLHWVIKSPFLTRNLPEPDFRNHKGTNQLLKRLEENPEIILDDLALMKRHNLGSYFETLVSFWLKNLPDVQIIAQNRQIRNEGNTIGELDLVFLFNDVYYHWELAVKFYANTDDTSQESCWVGPLKKDTLKRKFTRLFDHQLPMVNHAIKTLNLRPELPVKSSPFVKGVLFHKRRSNTTDIKLPARVNPNCQKEIWLSVGELPRHFKNMPTHFAALPKLHWFSTNVYADWQQLTHYSQIEKLVNLNERPQLIAFGSSKHGSHPPLQIARHFIMPDDW